MASTATPTTRTVTTSWSVMLMHFVLSLFFEFFFTMSGGSLCQHSLIGCVKVHCHFFSHCTKVRFSAREVLYLVVEFRSHIWTEIGVIKHFECIGYAPAQLINLLIFKIEILSFVKQGIDLVPR